MNQSEAIALAAAIMDDMLSRDDEMYPNLFGTPLLWADNWHRPSIFLVRVYEYKQWGMEGECVDYHELRDIEDWTAVRDAALAQVEPREADDD